ncbi:MAG: hypothetical protein ABSF69_10690 [Polyangiaceae bacterium]|jgi:YVTN family beta-propeller protein
MILNKNQSRLFVANGNSDSVTIIDTASNTILETVPVLAPPSVFADSTGLKGANPNGLVLSPDETTLYVTDGATNAVAVVERDPTQPTGAHTTGLIPTGWYPTSVSTSADGTWLYITNAKSVPGPSCADILDRAGAHNERSRRAARRRISTAGMATSTSGSSRRRASSRSPRLPRPHLPG